MTQTHGQHAARQRWMGILSRAPRQALEEAWDAHSGTPEFTFLRRPETGLAMVRGRAGGKGMRFNLGEMTVTRCAVQVRGRVGHAYVAGRDPRHAVLAALFDALLQDDALLPQLDSAVLCPLETARLARDHAESERTAETRVNFFTLVRGED